MRASVVAAVFFAACANPRVPCTSCYAGDAGSVAHPFALDGGASPPLSFAFTGDTRPDACDDFAGYPKDAMNAIAAGMRAKGAAFALDTGDHMKVCKGTDDAARASALRQMQLYKSATDAFGGPFFYAMGNHECLDNKALCDQSDPSLGVFMRFLPGVGTPYYAFDAPAAHGVATFVFVADTAWGPDEAAWLESTLARADASRYTIVAKHVPVDDTAFSNADVMAVLRRHRVTLLLNGHAHEYRAGAEGGRAVTLGLGGAPVANSGDDFAFGLVAEQADGALLVTVYNAGSGLPRDAFTVTPN